MPLLDRLPALRSRNYRHFIAGNLISQIGNVAQTWAIMWQVKQMTGDPLSVGGIAIARVMPMLLLSLVGGVVADQTDRRRVLLFVQVMLAVVSVYLAFATIQGTITLWEIYAIVALWGAIRAFDGPSRGAMVPTLVPIEHLPSAVTINSVTWRLSDVLGPIVLTFAFWFSNAGLFALSLDGIAVVYLINALSFIPVIFALYSLPVCRPDWSNGEDKRIRRVREAFPFVVEGYRFVRKTAVVRNCMVLDFWATFFSSADALLPFVVVNLLMITGKVESETAFGLLASSIAVGSLLASVVMAFRVVPSRPGRGIILAVFAYGLFTVAFAFSSWLPLSMILLAGTGASDTVSTILRQTVRQLATPDEMRGRMTAFGQLFQISGPQLGDFEAGALARFTGERFAIWSGGAACCAIAWMYWRVRTLRDYRILGSSR